MTKAGRKELLLGLMAWAATIYSVVAVLWGQHVVDWAAAKGLPGHAWAGFFFLSAALGMLPWFFWSLRDERPSSIQAGALAFTFVPAMVGVMELAKALG